MKPHLTIIESPFAGDFKLNIAYARLALRDSCLRHEIPFASHLLYPQALDDEIPRERSFGFALAETYYHYACKAVFYTDLGISNGMLIGAGIAQKLNLPVEHRHLFATDLAHLDKVAEIVKKSLTLPDNCVTRNTSIGDKPD